MTRRGQHVCVLAAMLACLALTITLVGSPEPRQRAPLAVEDEVRFPTRDLPAPEAKPGSQSPPIVREGVVVLLATIVWTAGRTLLPGGSADPGWRAFATWLQRAAWIGAGRSRAAAAPRRRIFG